MNLSCALSYLEADKSENARFYERFGFTVIAEPKVLGAPNWFMSIRCRLRKAADTLSGADFAPGVAQNWAHYFVSEKSEEPNSLKTDGEPGRTRTCNPLISTDLVSS